MKDIIIGLALLFIIPSVFYFWNFLIYLDLFKPKFIKDYDPNKIYLFYYCKSGYGKTYNENIKRRQHESFTKKTNGKES